jgi:hypothetical protein
MLVIGTANFRRCSTQPKTLTVAESLSMGFDTEVELPPVMNADDLKKGLEAARQAM